MALVRLLAAGVVLFTSVAVGVLRCIIGRGVNCSSRNRLDGKVVLITGKKLFQDLLRSSSFGKRSMHDS